MYRAFVRRKIRRAFEALSRGDDEALLAQCAHDVHHQFPGDHPLGGTRHSVDALRRWFQRLRRLFPELRFEVRRIIVRGWPWDTIAVVEWIDRAVPQDGELYANEGVHVLRLSWGRVVTLRAHLDTQNVATVCRRLAEMGISEAAAAPIEDGAPTFMKQRA